MDRKHDFMSDHELMLAVRDSDVEGFAALFDRYAKRLQWFFSVLGRDEHLAEDLTQETFLRVWRVRDSYAPSGTVEGYLLRIARNLWLNWKRDAARRPALDLAAGEHVLAVAAAEVAA